MTDIKSKRSKKTAGAPAKRTKASKTHEPELIIAPEERAMAKAKPARKATTARKLFEFYGVIDKSIVETKGDSYTVNRCDPPHQYATRRTLPTICAESYGAGNFVALEVGVDSEGKPQGWARSYWVIKVRHGIRRPTFKEVPPSDEELRNHRQWLMLYARREGEDIQLSEIESHPYYSAFTLDGDVDKAQRGAEAGLVAALGLPTLPDPSITLNQLIKELKRAKLSDQEIIDSLVDRRAEFPKVFESRISGDAARNIAKQKVQSYYRSERRRRQLAKGRKRK